MTDIIKNISHLIESQFPGIYREDAPQLVAFIEAYYRFLESDPKYHLYRNRTMFENDDIDTVEEELISHFKEKYLKDFNFDTVLDKRFIIKNILDLYSSKGSERSVKLLFRMLFNKNAEVYYPAQDILKPSSSQWTNPIYLELTYSPRTQSFLNQQITGVNSRATAFVESIVTKRINGRLVDIAFISNLKGNFETGEYISNDGNLTNVPRVAGSMNRIEIVNGGRNNKIGDVYDVNFENGAQGKVRVTGIANETGRVTFELLDGGHGYTLNGAQAAEAGHVNTVENSTDVYVSERVLKFSNEKFTHTEIESQIQRIINTVSTIYLNNPNVPQVDVWRALTRTSPLSFADKDATKLYRHLISIGEDGYFVVDFDKNGFITQNDYDQFVTGIHDDVVREYLDGQFIDLEKIVQPIETLTLLSATDVNEQHKIGDILVGVNSDEVPVANGVIISLANTNSDGETIQTESALSKVILQVNNGTFNAQVRLELEATTPFANGIVGETIEEGREITITLTQAYDHNDPGTTKYQVGEKVSQAVYELVRDANNDIVDTQFVSYGIGYVKTITQTGDNAELVLDPAWGTFSSGVDADPNFKDIENSIPMDGIIGYTSGASAVPVVAGVIYGEAARGRLSSISDVDPSEIIIDDINIAQGETVETTFTPGNWIRGSQSLIESQIIDSPAAITNGGAVNVYLNGDSTANGILDTIANSYAVGYVTGQNSTSIGLHSTENEFFGGINGTYYTRQDIAGEILNISLNSAVPTSNRTAALFELLRLDNSALADIDGDGIASADDAFAVAEGNDDGRFDYLLQPKFIVNTLRDSLIYPPRDQNGGIIELRNIEIDSVSSGVDANFEIGSLEDEETVSLATDLVGDFNVANVPYWSTKLDGSASGLGFMDSVDIIDFKLVSGAYYVVDFREDYNYTLDYPTFVGIRELWDDETDTANARIPLGFIQDEEFTSNNCSGIITWARWEYLNETSGQVEYLTRAILRIDAVTNPYDLENPLSTQTLKIGDIVTGSTSGHERVVVAVKQLSKYVQRGLYLVQGDFDDPLTNDLATANTAARISRYDEDATSSTMYIYDMDEVSQTLGITHTDFNGTNETYLIVDQADDETLFIRLGQIELPVGGEVIDTRKNGYSSRDVQFNKGGYDEGNVLVPAYGYMTANSSGYPDTIEIVNPGAGYWHNPEPDAQVGAINLLTPENYPVDNVTDSALVIPNGDFGYGFPKSPHGDNKSRLRDLFTIGQFTIGKITSLTDINPGAEYNEDPFIKINNKYTSGYKRGNFYVDISITSGQGFIPNERIYQEVAGEILYKGTVISSSQTRLTIQRDDWSVAFQDDYSIIGSLSNTRANYVDSGTLTTEPYIWGDNAEVSGSVIVANGVATSVEVIDSGFGYEQGELVTMTNPDKSFVLTGNSILERQGKGEGFWKSYASHINGYIEGSATDSANLVYYDSGKRIRDNDFYQEFSYEILSDMSINRYESVVKDTLHVAGTKLFGGVVIESEDSMRVENFTEVDELVEVRVPILTEGGDNIVVDGSILVRTTKVLRA